MLTEFKEFALKGNAIALAVGLVMGVAFNAIVTAIVENLINPLVGVLMGGTNLSTATFTLGGVTFGWGAVIGALINFFFVALTLFIVVKAVAKLDKEPDPTTRPCPFCVTDIDKSATRCPACTSEVTAVA